MITEGLLIMSLGLGTVLLFFFVMIFVVNLQAKFITALNKRFPEASAQGSDPVPTEKIAVNDAVAVAIAAAARYSKEA